MYTLNDLRDLLQSLGMFQDDVEETITEAELLIQKDTEKLREKLQGADPADLRPSSFCKCGRTDYQHNVRYFGSEQAEAATRAAIEHKVASKGIQFTIAFAMGLGGHN